MTHKANLTLTCGHTIPAGNLVDHPAALAGFSVRCPVCAELRVVRSFQLDERPGGPLLRDAQDDDEGVVLDEHEEACSWLRQCRPRRHVVARCAQRCQYRRLLISLAQASSTSGGGCPADLPAGSLGRRGRRSRSRCNRVEMALPGSGRQQRMKTGGESSRRRRPSLVQVKPVTEWDVGGLGHQELLLRARISDSMT